MSVTDANTVLLTTTTLKVRGLLYDHGTMQTAHHVAYRPSARAKDKPATWQLVARDNAPMFFFRRLTNNTLKFGGKVRKPDLFPLVSDTAFHVNLQS